jgi:hypothetical protein
VKAARPLLAVIVLIVAAIAFLGPGFDGEREQQQSPPRFELRPDPRHPEDDRSAMQDDDCLTKLERTRSRPCVYGEPGSETTVVLFGDSLAMQYFPAVEAIAKRRGWRLVGLTKAGCPPVRATVFNLRLEREYRECAAWQEHTLRRIERVERPSLILVGGRMSTPAVRQGRTLGPGASRAALAGGYAAMLARLEATGAEVLAFKHLPRSPRNVPDCLVRAEGDPAACEFSITPANSVGFDARVVRNSAASRLLDLTPVICPDGRCQAAIDGAIVFRDFDHMTPTFARRLAPVIAGELPAIG